MRAFTNMQAWLDKARDEGKDEAQLLAARLAPDMRPLSFQFQTASDNAKGADYAVKDLPERAAVESPAEPDTRLLDKLPIGIGERFTVGVTTDASSPAVTPWWCAVPTPMRSAAAWSPMTPRTRKRSKAAPRPT